MNHKVRNVQELYVSAEQLYKQGVTEEILVLMVLSII